MAKKYIDAEKLIANLERQNVDKKVIEPVIRIINSLQQEQPSEDLEAEMGRFLANVTPSFKDGSYRITRYGFRAVARHFYELGQQAKQEE